jgi:hypothetical protein
MVGQKEKKMKLTKRQLKRIIRESMDRIVRDDAVLR